MYVLLTSTLLVYVVKRISNWLHLGTDLHRVVSRAFANGGILYDPGLGLGGTGRANGPDVSNGTFALNPLEYVRPTTVPSSRYTWGNIYLFLVRLLKHYPETMLGATRPSATLLNMLPKRFMLACRPCSVVLCSVALLGP